MSTKRLGNDGAGSFPQPGGTSRTRSTGKREKIAAGKGKERVHPAEVEAIEPKHFEGTINDVESPLRHLVESGRDNVGERSYGGDPQERPRPPNALSVQISGRISPERPEEVFSQPSRDNVRTGFVKLGLERPRAGELVDHLASLIGGYYTDPAARKSRDRGIQGDITEVRDGITDILKMPLAERAAKMSKLLRGLGERTQQLQERTRGLAERDLPDALKVLMRRVGSATSAVSCLSDQVLPAKA